MVGFYPDIIRFSSSVRIGGENAQNPGIGLRMVDPRLDDLSTLDTKESRPRVRIS
jgi:hypothetical protein